MRDLLYLFAFTALLPDLSACSLYYYSTLNSNGPVGGKNERSDLVQESDTVRIFYRSWGENVPVIITIYNRLDEPLYADWERSALITDDVVTTYDPKVASVRGESSSVVSGSSFHQSNRNSSEWSHSEGSFSGDVGSLKGVELILSHSELVNTPLQLTSFPFDKIPKEEYVKERMTTKANTTVNIRVRDFTEEDSPLRFRSYLTLFAGGTNRRPLRHSSFERNLYLTEPIKVGDVVPQYFDEGQQQPDDFFYVKGTHRATVGLVIRAVAVTTAGVAVEAALDPVSCQYIHIE